MKQSLLKCRLCMGNKDVTFDLYGVSEKTISTLKRVQDILQIELPKQKNLPGKMCQMCWDNVHELNSFRETVKENQMKWSASLIEMIVVKCEPLPEIDSRDTTEYPMAEVIEPEVTSEPVKREFEAESDSCDSVADNPRDPDFTCFLDKPKPIPRAEKPKKEKKTPNPNPPMPTDPELIKLYYKSKKAYLIRKREKLMEHKKELRSAERPMREMGMFICQICGNANAENMSGINRHMRDAHNGATHTFYCCNKNIASHNALDHYKWHLDKEAFKCADCGKVFHNRISLFDHISKAHLPEKYNRRTCEICGKGFYNLNAFKSHMVQEHFPEKKKKTSVQMPLVCELCGKMCPSQKSLNKHTRVHHMERKREECPVCGRMVLHLGNHMVIHKTPEPVSCDQCGNTFARNSLLKAHIKFIHMPRRHPCTLCDKVFSIASRLKDHIASIHTGETPHKCLFCPQSFPVKRLRLRHYAVQHEQEFAEYKMRDGFQAQDEHSNGSQNDAQTGNETAG